MQRLPRVLVLVWIAASRWGLAVRLISAFLPWARQAGGSEASSIPADADLSPVLPALGRDVQPSPFPSDDTWLEPGKTLEAINSLAQMGEAFITRAYF